MRLVIEDERYLGTVEAPPVEYIVVGATYWHVIEEICKHAMPQLAQL
jgi:hypothetical protein